MVRGSSVMRKQRSMWRLIQACGGAALAGLLSMPVASAPHSSLSIERLSSAALQLESIQASIKRSGSEAELSLRIGRLRAAELQIEDVGWRCALRREAGAVRCSGPLRWRDGPKGTLLLSHDSDWQARWRSGQTQVDAAVDAALDGLSLAWRQLPLAWLNGPAAGSLPEGLSITAGEVSGKASGDTGFSAWRGSIDLQAAALDSVDGLIAAAGIDASIGFHWRDTDSARLELDIELAAGELLYEQLYVPLAAGSRVDLALASMDVGWSLAGPLRLRDPEGAELSLALPATSGAAAPWTLSARLPDLARSGPRYLDGPLAAAGFSGAAFAGGLDVDLSGDGTQLQGAVLAARGLTFADPQGVVVLSGLEGEFAWQAEGAAPPSRIAWQALSLQGIALGPATLAGASRDGVFEALEPLQFAPFAGRLSLFPLRIAPAQARADFEARMDDIRLAALSAQLGWPEFEGRVSGSLPAASYRNHVLSSEGSLVVDVFDGQVQVGALRWERPFGVAPSIAAEVDIHGLDLEPLTGAFGFGSITGRLDGYVHGLRVLDGSPVAFDAFLHTDEDWKGRRRISQRAVNNIGSVGGGAAAGLQQTVLSLFDTFGYRRIGLRCRLINNVCEMGGVEDLENGYVLIEGAGLPRVTVNGYRRRVDWPVLLARLQAAAGGGGISVD